ncbi:MAG: hypothetical protein KIT11_01030 [Fimbriimonadaceae bacterium]|nr:hypothetical protein [Fimbriimonadaceae bacterium]QYK55043.1 MAG: hypothetical protein KF733_08505 [Fimbriimonadaceae bacterium]
MAFLAATALDFAPVFARPRLKELGAASLLADRQRYGTPLYAFVVCRITCTWCEERAVFDQKVRHVHDNPVRAGLCARGEE